MHIYALMDVAAIRVDVTGAPASWEATNSGVYSLPPPYLKFIWKEGLDE